MAADMTLLRAPIGLPLVLDEVSTSPVAARRLLTFGLREGASLTLLQRTASGGRIALVGESRIALGKDVCKQLGVSRG
ncbi:MAG: ferrous iron transport protein A [Propionibacteriaceae bacterium]|jgi:Fe2+ transport system protein FeoA|nr:ferrous iron transport protein A [Propionibacteriaceae bacterium]